MKLKLRFTLIFSFLFSCSYAQNQFQKLVGTGFPGEAHSFCISMEGGYVAACAGSLIKVDTSGHVVWVKKYLTPAMYNQSKVIRQMNGGYLVIYDIKFGGVGGNDIMVFNTDSAGQIDWIKIYGGTGYDVPNDVKEMDNGDFVICGRSNAFDLADNDMLLMRINKYGNQYWQRSYGSNSNDDNAEKLVVTASGDIIMAGCLSSQNSIIRTNAEGVLQWSKTYGYGCIYDMVENPATGDLFACGRMVPDNSKSGENMFVMNTDSSGNVKWAKMIGNDANESAYSISANSDFSQVYVAGQEHPDSSAKGDAVVLCLAGSDGSINWSKSYGTSQNEVFYDNLLLNDNTLVNVGFSDYSDTSYHNLYIVKTAADGVSGCNEAAFMPSLDSNLSIVAINFPADLDSGELTVISKCYPPSWTAFAELTLCTSGMDEYADESVPFLYPNPLSGESQIDIVAGLYCSCEIFDMSGKRLKAYPIEKLTDYLKVNGTDYAGGFYMLKLIRGNGSFTTIKFVVE